APCRRCQIPGGYMLFRAARCLAICLAAGWLLLAVEAGAQLRITLPKRSKPTPVQKLNREGVNAVNKHDYEKAKKLFYKAYLIDPNDPLTLTIRATTSNS